MDIVVNEACLEVEPGTTLLMLKRRHCPEADVVILNGAPIDGDRALGAGDRVVFIRKGVVPGRAELEALMMARHSPGVFSRLKEAAVGIAGVGGLGSSVAIALARMGVGRLILADHDVVEPSNLNRQHYFVDQIGQPKVRALRETLLRVNPYCQVDERMVFLDEENVPEVFGGVDVLVEALDRAEAKAMLIEAAMKGMPGVPVVAASGLAGYEPANSIRTRQVAHGLYIVGDLTSEAAVGRGLMACRVGIAAHHQANAVVRLLMGEDPAA